MSSATRDTIRAAARTWADDPETVTELVHEGFNADTTSGGFAFLCDRGVLIGGADGTRSWSVDPGDDAGRRALVEQTWAAARHRNRPLDPADLGPLHRAALAALVGGSAGTGDPQADHLLVHLRRLARARTEEAALRAFAANDWLLEEPAEHARAHPCPLCGRPAIGGPRYATAVCDACYPRTVCSHARGVRGSNTSFGGGFEAHHADDDSVCAQVTGDGRCWIGDRECAMGEARFGGVYVIVPARGT